MMFYDILLCMHYVGGEVYVTWVSSGALRIAPFVRSFAAATGDLAQGIRAPGMEFIPKPFKLEQSC